MTDSVPTGFQLDVGVSNTLSISGALDFSNASSAWLALKSALVGRSITQLDLTNVKHSDSAGLSCVLAVIAESVQRGGQRLKVIHMPSGMLALAQVCGVDGLLA